MTCPVCNGDELRAHTAEEMVQYHPNAGHGYTPETGWTKPELDPRIVPGNWAVPVERI